MTVQAIHCSDLHLDKNFNISNYKRRLQRKEDINENFEFIVDYAIKENPDIFLISGDVYDKVTPTNSTQKFFIEQLKKLNDSGIKVFMIGGNHDVPKAGESMPLAIDIPASAGLATVFSQTDSIAYKVVELDGKKVCISGMSFDPFHERENPLKDKNIPLFGKLNILLLHASFHGLDVESSMPSMTLQNPVYQSDFSKLNLDYLGLGHYHNYFEREMGSLKIGNPGSIEKVTFQEEADEKGFLWIEFNDEVETEFIKLETRPLETINLKISKDDGSDVVGFIQNKLKSKSNQEKIVRVIVEGIISQEQNRSFKIRELVKYCNEHFFHVKLELKWEVEGYGKLFIGKVDRPLEAYQKRLDKIIVKSPKDKEFLERVRLDGVNYLGGLA